MKITFQHRFSGEIKTGTLSGTPYGHYYASMLVDGTQYCVAPVVQEIPPENTLGIDL